MCDGGTISSRPEEMKRVGVTTCGRRQGNRHAAASAVGGPLTRAGALAGGPAGVCGGGWWARGVRGGCGPRRCSPPCSTCSARGRSGASRGPAPRVGAGRLAGQNARGTYTHTSAKPARARMAGRNSGAAYEEVAEEREEDGGHVGDAGERIFEDRRAEGGRVGDEDRGRDSAAEAAAEDDEAARVDVPVKAGARERKTRRKHHQVWPSAGRGVHCILHGRARSRRGRRGGREGRKGEMEQGRRACASAGARGQSLRRSSAPAVSGGPRRCVSLRPW